ncbi:MAG: DUF1254 domain-containing protein [Candidatus Berkiella sp.]
MINKSALITLTALAATSLFIPTSFANDLKKGEVQAIAEEAFIYAYPMIMAYGIMYEYNIDKSNGQYKGPFNQITNESQVYTPKDTADVTPNSDTPNSFISKYIRAEPMVIRVPKDEKNRNNN